MAYRIDDDTRYPVTTSPALSAEVLILEGGSLKKTTIANLIAAAITNLNILTMDAAPGNVAATVKVGGASSCLRLASTNHQATFDNSLLISADLTVSGETAIGAIISDSADVGFFNTSAQPKATVTGSKGANAALTSLISALSGYGFITNSTT